MEDETCCEVTIIDIPSYTDYYSACHTISIKI